MAEEHLTAPHFLPTNPYAKKRVMIAANTKPIDVRDGGTTQMPHIPILLPLVVGTGAILCTILIQAVLVGGTIWFVRRERKTGRTGRSFWADTGIVVPVVLLVMMAHLIEIAVWAIVFVFCGEFADIATAYYQSAGNFTTLGSGDVLLSPHWRMLGPLEAANGMLMFGVSTAQIFAVVARLAQTRFER